MGDASRKEGLLCGCVSSHDRPFLLGLAARADASMMEMLRSPPPPEDVFERAEFDDDVAASRSSRPWSPRAGSAR